METDYKGIDYGRGVTNIDAETGIRYGVIPMNAVLQAWADSAEPNYGEEVLDREDLDGVEPYSYDYEGDGYIANQSDDNDIFITKSPYYTYAQYCSPCAPGACYLLNPCKDGERAYCFGHDWFEDGKAPYPVFDVKTGHVVNPE